MIEMDFPYSNKMARFLAFSEQPSTELSSSARSILSECRQHSSGYDYYLACSFYFGHLARNHKASMCYEALALMPHIKVGVLDHCGVQMVSECLDLLKDPLLAISQCEYAASTLDEGADGRVALIIKVFLAKLRLEAEQLLQGKEIDTSEITFPLDMTANELDMIRSFNRQRN